jgi:hypothetical protein
LITAKITEMKANDIVWEDWSHHVLQFDYSNVSVGGSINIAF